MSALYRLLHNLLLIYDSTLFTRPALSILIYHRILETKDPLLPDEVDQKEFETQLIALSKHYQIITLRHAIALMKAGSLPNNALCITFDDGYENNYSVALPILLKHNLTATFFIASGFLDGGIMWNDVIIELVRNTEDEVLDLSYVNLGQYKISTDVNERRDVLNSIIKEIKHLDGVSRSELIEKIMDRESSLLPKDLMMSSEQVRKMSESGMEIGGHTLTHPILSKISDHNVEIELVKDKSRLEKIIGKSISSFAYPNGKKGQDYLDKHAHLVKSIGYEQAVSTNVGITRDNSDLFQLPRYTPWDKNVDKFLLKLMLNKIKW